MEVGDRRCTGRLSSGDHSQRSWVQFPHWSECNSLSLCGCNSISRVKAHMVYMGTKLALHITI